MRRAQLSSTHLALFVLAASSAMVGFDGGCGAIEPNSLPPPPNPPPQTECADLLDEASCTADARCSAVYVELACPAICQDDGHGGCVPCPSERSFVGCQDREPPPVGCATHGDEASCSADPACEVIHVACGAETGDAAGFRAPCEPGTRCGCEEAPSFGGCRERAHECPPTCAIFCEFGNVLDANGCATCSCNPPPGGCEGLDEQSCINASPRCSAIYEGGTGNDAPGAAPCAEPGCGRPVPPPHFVGCVDNNVPPPVCEGLDERTCASTPGCHGDRLYPPCARPCEPDRDPNCDASMIPICEPVFVCLPDETRPECFSDFDCPGGFCAFDGGFAPPSDPSTGGGSSGDAARPAPGGQCIYVSCGDGTEILCDRIPPSCGVGQIAGASNGCWACYDARSCQPVDPPSGCTSDADCPTGYCEYGGMTEPAAPGDEDPTGLRPIPPPPAGQCVAVSCGDGSAVVCDMLPPSCGPGAVPGVLNGCYACFDARSCTPLGQTPDCFADSDCPNGYCEYGAGFAPPSSGGGSSGEARALPPAGGQCVFPSCGDGSQLACRMMQPLCDPGMTAAIINGCYECVDARACGVTTPGCDPATGVDCG